MSARQSTALRAQQLALAAAIGITLPRSSHGKTPAAPQLAGGASSRGRLAVYQQAYGARLLAALADNYAVLARAMGDDGFKALGRAYLAAQPSRQASIRWFGHRLPDFMDQDLAADGSLVAHPALADLARLDWATGMAFDAADAPTLAASALTEVPVAAWSGLRLQLHPSVQALGLHWVVAPAWHALQRAAAAAIAVDAAIDVDAHTDTDEPSLPPPEASEHTLLVWRRALGSHWRVLGDSEAALLRAAAAGDDFNALCTLADELHADEAQAVQAVVSALQQWLADGLVSRWLSARAPG